jgi:hypothetical protein
VDVEVCAMAMAEGGGAAFEVGAALEVVVD